MRRGTTRDLAGRKTTPLLCVAGTVALLLACACTAAEAQSPRLIHLRSTVIDTTAQQGDFEVHKAVQQRDLGSGRSQHNRRLRAVEDAAIPNAAGRQWTILVHMEQILEAQRRSIKRLGGEILSYLPHHTLLVLSRAPDAIAHLEGVLWVGELKPHMKIDPHLEEMLALAVRKGEAQKRFEAFVSMTPGFSFQDWAVRTDKLQLGCFLRQVAAQKLLIGCAGEHMRQAYRWVANQTDVIWIELKAEFEFLNKFSVPITISGTSGSSATTANVFHQYGIQGQGEIAGLADTGIDLDSCFFWDSTAPVEYDSNGFGRTHRKIMNYHPYADGTDASDGHGTHVAGSLVGDAYGNAKAPAAASYNGIAPKAKLAFYDIGYSGMSTIVIPDNFTDVLAWSYSKGVRVHTNAWGNGKNIYNTQAHELDDFSFNHPDMLVIFAGGNTGDVEGAGSIGAPATCKNCIAVGATQNSAAAFRDAGQGLRLYVSGLGDGGQDFFVQPASYGPDFRQDLQLFQLAKMLPTHDGCTAWGGSQAQPLMGKIAVIKRGDCYFTEKTRRAQRLGAVAVIFTDNVGGPIPPLMGHGAFDDITISSGMVSRATGERLWAALGTGAGLYGPGLQGRFAFDVEGYSEKNMATFSSRGPAFDGRIKPDLVAPGQMILSARSDGLPYSFQCGSDLHLNSSGIQELSGTSMAAPFVAGAALLIRQYFREGRFPTGRVGSSTGFEPTAALLRVLLILGAEALTGTVEENGHKAPLQPPPSNIQGFGRVRADRSVPFVPIAGGQAPFTLWFEETKDVKLGQSYSVCFVVSTSEIPLEGVPLKAVLAWTDPAAHQMAAFALVHDLNLEVTKPDGSRIFGNSITHPDSTNNAESVTIEDAPSGQYTISVQAANLGLASLQRFALAVSGRLTKITCQQPVPVPVYSSFSSAPTQGHSPPPPIELVSTFISPPAQTQTACAKDPLCFDLTYECSGCCAYGKAKNGGSCWGGMYTFARCCHEHGVANTGSQGNLSPAFGTPVPPAASIPVSAPSTPVNTPANQQTAGCAKDLTCFDSNYLCPGCCSTGKGQNGANCWSGMYTSARCCDGAANTGTQGVLSPATASPVPPVSAPAGPPVTIPAVSTVPQHSATCAKDETCFDSTYLCRDCCATGKTAAGANCWGGLYTAARCCNQ